MEFNRGISMILRHGIYAQNNPIPSVIDGSLIYLDSRNTDSYPGSGTTWFDLSGNNNNSTLVNGVFFDATNKSMVFDGINDRIQTPLNYTMPTGLENFTGFCTINIPNGLLNAGMIASNYQDTPVPFNVYQRADGKVSFLRRGTGGLFNLISTSLLNDGNDHVIAFRKNGNNYDIFIDSVIEASITASLGSSNVTNNFVLGDVNVLFNQQYQGSQYSFLLYNSALTDAEILYNSNTLLS
jgi:hypothetical protein